MRDFAERSQRKVISVKSMRVRKISEKAQKLKKPEK